MTWWRRLHVALLACVAATATASGQSAAVPSLTVAWQDLPVPEALQRLAAAGPMSLVWDAAAVRAARAPRISCRLDDATPEQVLSCVTREAGLDWYRLSSGTYVVIARAEAAPAYAALGGLVVDAVTGAPVPAAVVRLAERPLPHVAGDDGGFAFDRLPPGRYDLTVRAIGYRPLRRLVDLGPSARERSRVALEPVAALPAPIVVAGLRAGSASAGLGASSVADSAVAPLLVGPAFSMPGSAAPLGVSRRDGTGDLHLQGGDVGEHPWRLDGVPLYDAAALSGLLGSVAPLAIDRLTVRRSGFRARDGSFATGAIDLSHGLRPSGAPAGAAAPRAVVAADPLAVSARLGAPLRAFGARGEGMVAIREGTWGRTAPAALTSAIRAWSAPDPLLLRRVGGFGALEMMNGIEGSRFATVGREAVALREGHAAARLDWRDLRTLEATAFHAVHGIGVDGTAADSLGRSLETRDAYAWRATGGQIAFRSLLGTRVRQVLQVRTVVHALDRESQMRLLSPVIAQAAAIPGREGNRIEEVGARAEWTATGASGWDVAGGVDAARTGASVNLVNGVLRPVAAEARVARLTLWGDATWPVGRGWFLEGGLRVTQLETGRTYGEPRLALRAEGGGDRPWAWRLAGGGYHQFVSQFDVASTSPMAFVPSVRFWLPMDGRLGVARAWHAAAEAVLRPWTRWELRAEGYARWHPAIPMLDYGMLYDARAGSGSASAVGAVSAMGDMIGMARGYAAGAGVRVVHDGAIGAWPTRLELAYDAGVSRRTFPSRFGGSAQPVPWLEPHRALVALDMRPVPGLVAALRGRGVFGRPWALRQAYYDLFGTAPLADGIPLDDPGALRRPAILDVDVGVQYERRFGRATLTVGAAVANVFDRANVLDFGLRRDAGGGYQMVPRLLPGRMPTLTLRIVP